MGAPAPRPRARRPASPAPVVPRLPFGDTTTPIDALAAMVKTAIVDSLVLLPDTMQRPAAAVVRAVWPGFRSV